MFKSSSTLAIILVLALLLTSEVVMAASAAGSTSGASGVASKACLRKMAAYVNAICEGRQFAVNAEEVIVAACQTHINIESFISEICPDV